MMLFSCSRMLRTFLARRRTRALVGVMLLTIVVGGSCTRTFSYLAVPLASSAQVVESPVKAHLLDGSTIVFADGAVIDDILITGTGARFDIRLDHVGSVSGIALDSVVAMESFLLAESDTLNLESIADVVIGATAGTALLGVACLYLCGSCPTVYSDSLGTERLEAEAFSYSIAPLFEARDIDRLAAGVDEHGEVRLTLRNEFLETHYINHLELIEVAHASDERVVPDPLGRPLVLAQPLPLRQAVNRDGLDVTHVLSRRDSLAYTSSPSRIGTAAASSEGDVRDYIEFEVALPPETAEVGLHLRMRNSLLSTVLFYEMMLGDRGVRALDWLGRDLREIGPAVELGQWAADNLGMRVSVSDGGDWREVARIGDEGPLAWADVAVLVPTGPGPSNGSVRIRLAFPADHWRLDQVTPFGAARHAEGRLIPVSEVRAPDGTEQPRILSQLASPDESYLVTSPGHSFSAVFRPGRDRPDVEPRRNRTFFLASQGYYIEWVRASWLSGGRETTPFQPGPGTLVEALRRWHASREEIEERFHAVWISQR